MAKKAVKREINCGKKGGRSLFFRQLLFFELESASSLANFSFDDIDALLIDKPLRDQAIVSTLIAIKRKQANLPLTGIAGLLASVQFSRKIPVADRISPSHCSRNVGVNRFCRIHHGWRWFSRVLKRVMTRKFPPNKGNVV